MPKDEFSQILSADSAGEPNSPTLKEKLIMAPGIEVQKNLNDFRGEQEMVVIEELQPEIVPVPSPVEPSQS